MFEFCFECIFFPQMMEYYGSDEIDELFECVWPFREVGTYRVKGLIIFNDARWRTNKNINLFQVNAQFL